MSNFRQWLENEEEDEVAQAVAKLIAHYDQMYPRAGKLVDGRTVLPNIDNMSSIGATLTDYETLPGVRDFPIHGFGGKSSYYAADDQRRVVQLAAQIEQSKKISPIIIVEEKNGPYVLEGGHRISALVELKAKSIPALIVLDIENLL